MLTNDIVSFEQSGPGLHHDATCILSYNNNDMFSDKGIVTCHCNLSRLIG